MYNTLPSDYRALAIRMWPSLCAIIGGAGRLRNAPAFLEMRAYEKDRVPHYSLCLYHSSLSMGPCSDSNRIRWHCPIRLTPLLPKLCIFKTSGIDLVPPFTSTSNL